MTRSTLRLLAPFTALLVLTTFSLASASPSFVGDGKKHKAKAKSQSIDSLAVQLQGLNDVLRKLDTALMALKGKTLHVHVDSQSFGPYHTPKVKTPKIDIPEYDIHIPEIDIPSITIPKVRIPEIDNSFSIGDSDETMTFDSTWKNNLHNFFDNHFLIPNGLGEEYAFDEDTNGLYNSLQSQFASLAPAPETTPYVTRDYYFDGNTRYFIANPNITEPKAAGTVRIIPGESDVYGKDVIIRGTDNSGYLVGETLGVRR